MVLRTGSLRVLLMRCRGYTSAFVRHHRSVSSDTTEDGAGGSFRTCSTERHTHDAPETTSTATASGEEDGGTYGVQKVKSKVDVQPPEAAKILRYLRKTAKLTDQDIHSYSYTAPSVLGMSLADIQARVEKLQRVSFKSYNKERLGIVLARFPHIVHVDLANVHGVCQLLEKYKFNRNWIRSLLRHHPSLFTRDPSKLEVNLKAMTQAGLTGRDIFQLLNKMPLLLTHQPKHELGQVIQHWKQLSKEEKQHS